MKIAIASEGKTQESEISEIAGRAPYYLIFEEKELIKVIKNPFLKGQGGVGRAVAQMLENERVDLVISGQFGTKMIPVLDEKKIDYKEMTGKVNEAIQ